MPDNEILVEAHLNIPKAKSDIQEELNKIAKDLKLHIGNIDLNSKEVDAEVKKLKDNISKAFKQSDGAIGDAIGNQVSTNIKGKLKNIEKDTKDLANQLQNKFGKIGDVTTSWAAQANGEIESCIATVKKLSGEVEKYKYQRQDNESDLTFVGITGTDNAAKKVAETQMSYLKRIKDEYKNISNYKKRLNSAGENETDALKSEIKKSQTRISYYKSELKHRDLLTASVQREIDTYKRLNTTQEALNKSKALDNNIKSQAEQLEKSAIAANKYQTQLNNLYGKYTDKNGKKSIKEVDNVEQLKSKFAETEILIDSLKSANSETFKSIDADVQNAINNFKAFAAQLQNAEYVANQLRAKDFKTIKTDEANKLDTFINKIKMSYTGFDSMKASVSELQTLLDNAFSPEDLIVYLNKLSNVKSEFDMMNSSAKIAQDNSKARQDADRIVSNMEIYKSDNSLAVKKYRSEIESIIAKAKELRESTTATTKETQALSREASNLKAKINAAGQAGKTNLDIIKEKIAKFTGWYGISQMIMGIVNKMSEMVRNVIEIDTAITNLKKVTDETSASYDKFLDNAIEKSKELHIKLSDIINQSAEWAKQGYNINEASTLSQASGIYSVVGEVDNATAVQDITTALKSYKLEAEDAIGIVDKLNNISNKYATTAADIGTILSNSASSLAVAGNTIDQNIAMGVAIREITGDAAAAGATLKVLSMRLRGAKTELQDAGEDTEGMAESTSKLREQIMALTNVGGNGGFDIMSDPNTFKSTYEIMLGISKVWDKLTDVSKASIIEQIAGKNRGNTVTALLENMAQAQKIVEDSTNSSGSAMEEYQKYLESAEGKIAGFQNQFEILSQTLLSSDLFKNAIDSGTKFLELLTNIIDKFGTLPTLATAVGAVMSFKNVGIFKVVDSGVVEGTKTLQIFGKQLDDIYVTYNKFRENGNGVFKSLWGSLNKQFSAKDLAAFKKYNGLLADGKTAEEAFKLSMTGASAAAQKVATSTGAAAIDVTALSVAEKAATVSSRALAIGLNLVKAAATMGASLVISILIEKLYELVTAEDDSQQKHEEYIQKLKEESEEYQQSVESIQDYIKQVKELRSKTSLTADEREQLLNIQKELIDTYGSEVQGIDLVNGKYDEQIAKLRELEKEKAGVNRSKLESLFREADKNTKDNIANDIISFERKVSPNNEQYFDVWSVNNKELNSTDSNNATSDKIFGILKDIKGFDVTTKEKSDITEFNLSLGEVDSRQKADAISTALAELNKNLTYEEKKEQSYTEILLRLNELYEIYDKEATERETYLSKIAEKSIIEYTSPDNIDYSTVTTGTYKAWSEGLINEFAKDDPELRQAIQNKLKELYDDSYRLQMMTPSDLEYYWRNQLEKQIPSTFDVANYTEQVDAIEEKINTVNSAIEKLDDNKLTMSDRWSLVKDFPDLLPYINDTAKLREKLVELGETAPNALIDKLELLKKKLTDKTQIQACQNLIDMLKQLGATATEISPDDYLKSQTEYVDKIIDKLKDEKEAQQDILDNLKKQKEQLEDIISSYKTAADTAMSFIDKQIEGIESQKESVNNKYDERIKPIDEEIERLEKENEQIDRNIELQKARDNLANARKTKVRVYTESSGWVEETDVQAVKDAQKELDDIQKEVKIGNLKDKRDNVEKQRDTEIAALDDEIKSYEDYKQAFQDAVDSYTNSQDELTAQRILGANWHKKVKEKDTDTIDTFAKDYSSYQKKLDDTIEKEIKSQEKSIEETEKRIQMFEDYKTSITNAATEVSNKLSGLSNGLSDFNLNEKSTYEDILQSTRDFVNEYTELWAKANNISITSILKTKSDSLDKVLSASKTILNTIGESLGLKVKLKGYSTGGVNTQTGVAMLHGTSQNPEVVFNSSQAKELYDIIKGGRASQYIADSLKGSMRDTINNIKTENNKSVNYSPTINYNIDKVNAESYDSFRSYLDRYTKETLAQSWTVKK